MSKSKRWKAKRPKGKGWRKEGTFGNKDKHQTKVHIWAHEERGVVVMSSCGYMEGAIKGRSVPQWLISISKIDTRFAGPSLADDDLCAFALEVFGFAGLLWEEDNHEPGTARKFFLPIAPADRVACECKETEEVITFKDGYTFSFDGSYDLNRATQMLRGHLTHE